MRIKIDVGGGKKYGFRFDYGTVEMNGGVERPAVWCYIEEDCGIRDGKSVPAEFVTRATGKSVCHPCDQYDKRFGRKLAFERAVRKAAWGCEPGCSASERKEIRRKFWDAFKAAGIRLPRGGK